MPFSVCILSRLSFATHMTVLSLWPFGRSDHDSCIWTDAMLQAVIQSSNSWQ